MADHTPGPWTVEEYGDADCPSLVLHSNSESRVCFMATPGSNGDPARITADANLIAASPDLLAACKEAMAEFNDCGMGGLPVPEMLRKAISKATRRRI